MIRIHGLRSSGCYPPGAEYASNAPFNEVRKKISICVSVTYHKDIEVEVVEGGYDEVTLNYLAREAVYDMHKFMDDDGWTEDEFEAIEE